MFLVNTQQTVVDIFKVLVTVVCIVATTVFLLNTQQTVIDIFDFLVTVVVIVAAIWSEVKERTPAQTGNNPVDAGSVENFFKSMPWGTSPQNGLEPSLGDSPAGEEETIEGSTSDDLSLSWGAPEIKKAYGSDGYSSVGGPRKSQRTMANALPDHFSPYGAAPNPEDAEDYDEAPSLTNGSPPNRSGEEGACALDPGAHRSSTIQPAVAPSLRFTRQQLKDSMILNFILERYDINRAINRLSRKPGKL